MPAVRPEAAPATGRAAGAREIRAVRVSRWVREHVEGGAGAVVVGVQRRACQLALDGGSLLILSRSDVPLAPNAIAVDVGATISLEDRGLRIGQVVAVTAHAPREPAPDWIVALDGAANWEPRPRISPIAPEDLAERVRTTRLTVIANGAEASLLPLLWTSSADLAVGPPAVARVAAGAALLVDAAIRRDAAALTRAARAVAGLGRGLTPSGDDLLAGFVAAWTLLGAAIGADPAARERVTAAIVTGATPGASPLGRAWFHHARRGELLEPMTRIVTTLLAPVPRDLDPAVHGALAVGASSGTDWMVGFLLAARGLLDGKNGER